MASSAEIDAFIARLNPELRARLAEAGALASVGGERRSAIWQAMGATPRREDELPLSTPEEAVGLRPLDELETIQWDYRSTGHSPRGHPLAPLREALRERRLPDAATVARFPHDADANYAGLVICRQRPGTAKGVVFMTLQDETGFVNLVVWQDVFARHRLLAKTASFLGVSGKVQSEAGVVHLVAERLWNPRLDLRPAETRSRDFQ